MAALSQSESRRLYSWWWDSHNSPKNSKWLQENLTDMDVKVKSMIKLIEEDADSFARRAEMYYKKRPELMKLVEEFYRAYRALAERYNHATGELRHAHRTIAKAFPDQIPLEFVEDSPAKPLTQGRDPRTPETKLPVRVLFGTDNLLNDDTPRKEDMEMARSSKSIEGGVWKDEKDKEQSFRDEVLERAGKAESEVEDLKKALSEMQAEKENVLLKYQECLAKLCNVEGELNSAQKDSTKLNEKASRAEIEVQTLKEALVQLEAEKNAGKLKHKEYLEKISGLEAMVSRLQEAESEAQTLKDEISRLEIEKEAVIQQYQHCVERVSSLENLISDTENEAGLLIKEAERAENEVSTLRKSLADLNKEKEGSALQYKCCLEMISKLERDILSAKEEVKRLNNEVLIGNLKLKTAEETCLALEMRNRSLQSEAENLMKKIGMKDQEVAEKQEELEKLQTCLHDEYLRYANVEATLQSLQSLHVRSQDDQRALALELKNVLQTLKDLEVSKSCLEEEIREVREENQAHSSLMENMQNEIHTLREIKERLEREVTRHIDLSNSLQQEILRLKEEIEGLNTSYQSLVEQVEAAGLDPKFVGTSLKSLHDENSKLREMHEEGRNERENLSKKVENVQELLNKKIALESSLLVLNRELESSREKVTNLQESCQYFHGEKATLVAEKASLLSQLQAVTENMHKILEKNAVLENTLSNAKVELEGLKERSKGLENICEMLRDERSFLLNERNLLANKLENVERKLESVETRYTGLVEKYAGLEKEKEAVHCRVEELKVSLSVEKQQRTMSQLESDATLASLENQIRFLKEENSWKKKEFEEELERSIKAQFEITILQKFIKDMEEKNYSLIIECQKHVEASKLAEKLISELEKETLEQQVESEVLLDEIERLRLGIYQVFKTVETGSDSDSNKIENDRTFLHHIVGVIEDMKCLISNHEDEKQLHVVENSVLLTLLEQLESKGVEIESQKMHLEKDFAKVKNEKDKLIQMNRKLKSDVNESHQNVASLEAELASLCTKHDDLHRLYVTLQEVYTNVNQDNANLLKKFVHMKKENDAAIMECLVKANETVVLRGFGEEKLAELRILLKDLNRQHEINCRLGDEMCLLMEKLELQKAENLVLKDAIHGLEGEMQAIREDNVQMKKDVLSSKEILLQTELKLEAAENTNMELSRMLDELKTDMETKEDLESNVLELSEISSIQKKEIESLHIIRRNFESELGQLRREMEERLIREKILSSELHEFELWEAEATAFYFDFQISSIHEVMFKNKVQELTGVCRSLEHENSTKSSEIELMKGKICSMESEINGLKSQLCACTPIIAAIRDDLMFVEQNALLQTKLNASRHHESEFVEFTADPRKSASEMLEEDESLASLKNLQSRVKAVAKLMEELNKPVLHRRSSSKSKQESGEIEQPKSRRCLGREHSRKKGSEISETPKLQKIKTKPSEARSGMLMKDIPLDRVSNSSRKGIRKKDDEMLELWEDGNRDLTIGESLRMSYKMTDKDIVYDAFENVKRLSEPPSNSDEEKELGVDKWEVSAKSSEVSGRRVLERLASDAQKLENLQATVENLRSKLEVNKKGRKAKNMDYETVLEQLLEAEETVGNLADLNGKLVRSLEECPSPDGKASPPLKEAMKTRRRKVREQARKGSERIGRLQLEMQKIQYMLLKLEEEKKNKMRNKFLKSKTIILRDFIYNGRKNSGKRKKGPLCGCFRPSTTRNGTSP
ncbi:hypothetical protein ACS0TY_028029 [Phlomoides rotata]